MAFPPQQREAYDSLPSIRAPGPDHFKAPHYHSIHSDMSFGTPSPARIIPGLDTRDYVPPPLPPPTDLPLEGRPDAFEYSLRNNERAYGHGQSMSSSSATSGYGSMDASLHLERPTYKRRDTGSTTPDEGYASYASTESRFRESIPNDGRGVVFHRKCPLQSPADMHVDSMKKKLDSARSAGRPTGPSLLGSSMNDILSRKPNVDKRFPPPTLSMPIHSRGFLESPSRLTDTPVFSAVSPNSAHFRRDLMDRSRESSDAGSPRYRRRNNSDDANSSTTAASHYELGSVEDMEMDDAPSLRRMHIIDDVCRPGAGQKRRAESQLTDDSFHPGLPQSAISSAMRGSPTPRLTIPSAPSVASYSPGGSRAPSYMSGSSTHAAAGSFGRLSPGGTSPGGLSPTSASSPYNAPMSLNPSPRVSMSQRMPTHIRNVSGSLASQTEVGKSAGSRMDFFMCECCPKKPKKFETREDLSAHEAEKQYECSYCGNRFKNKNEAERHQNSLHVRRHSWSCSALSGYDRAFHDSPTQAGQADACGYCGDEFPRSGAPQGSGGLTHGALVRHATDQDWEVRIKHLQEVHKFRECNSSKKFFRADHFRQHLKHSHAGTSGKWTNMLEVACMIEEDPSPR